MSKPAGDDTVRLLTHSDVLAMLRPEFWEPHVRSALMAYRHCAVVALMACCHIGAGCQCGIKLAHWRPGGLDVVLVKRWGKTLAIPLTPQTIFVVERFITERARARCQSGVPRWDSEFLFVTEDGKVLLNRDITDCFARLKEGRGFFHRALLRFCARHIRAGSDSTVERRFRGFTRKLGSHNDMPDVSLAKLTQVVRDTNPFRDLDREIRGAVPAQKFLSKQPPGIAVPLPKRKPMPVEHPIVALLLRTKWPKDKPGRAELRADLRREHGAAIDKLLQSRVLVGEHVGRLFGIQDRSARKFHEVHYRSGSTKPKVVARAFRPKAEKASTTAEERELLKALRAEHWPRKRPEARGLSQKLLKQHFPAIDALIARRLLTVGVAARLFRAPHTGIRFLRAALKAGMSPAEVLFERTHAFVPESWWERVRSEESKRSGGETDRRFYFRMVRQGFPGHRDPFGKFLRVLRRGETMSPQEGMLVERLSNTARPEDPAAAEALSKQLLLAHFGEVRAMIDAKKIRHLDGAKLFDVPTYQIEYLTAALKAGLSLEQALRTNLQAHVPAAMWSTVKAELALSPDEPTRPFYFRMRLIHDFPGSERQMALFRAELRRSGMAAAANS